MMGRSDHDDDDDRSGLENLKRVCMARFQIWH